MRLRQNLVVTHQAGDKKSHGVVGLADHLSTRPHICKKYPNLEIKIDSSQDTPLTIVGCPARFYNVFLADSVYKCIELSEHGGLASLSNLKLAHLPYRLVSLYVSSLSARDRLLVERDKLYAKLIKQ